MRINDLNKNNNHTRFAGKVDSSVKKYVTSMKKESKKIYIESCQQKNTRLNPTAFRLIDERCNTALSKLTEKAESLHKDTVIKAVKNPDKSDNGLYFVAENKGLTQEWEQKGAVNTLSVYENDLKKPENFRMGVYDTYITRFEGLVNKLNPKTLDKKMVRISISNLWNLSPAKILRGNYAEKRTKSTQKIAKEIGYPNTTFPESLKEHFCSVRESFKPQKEHKPSVVSRIKSFFLG